MQVQPVPILSNPRVDAASGSSQQGAQYHDSQSKRAKLKTAIQEQNENSRYESQLSPFELEIFCQQIDSEAYVKLLSFQIPPQFPQKQAWKNKTFVLDNQNSDESKPSINTSL